MVKKDILAELSMCYSISVMTLSGKEYCVCASEERDGKIVAVDTQSGAETFLSGLPGGVMAMIQVPELPNAFLAINGFFPVFDSAKAKISLCRVPEMPEEGGGTLEMEVSEVAEVPYVHRIALAGSEGKRKIIVATLCSRKDFPLDWSYPGSVYAYELDENFRVKEIRTLIEGITKNHGMYTWQKNGETYLLIGGEGGLWSIDEREQVTKIYDGDISDLCMYDVDGDGTEEIVCIAPFHGDSLKVLKKQEREYCCIAEAPITFGHAVWAGPCGGENIIICCSRGGDRKTQIYRPAVKNGSFTLDRTDIDEGVGASNIAVQATEDMICLYASNHENNEVARYRIKED